MNNYYEDLYYIAINCGTIISLVVCALYLFFKSRKLRYFLYIGVYGICILIGGYVSCFVRVLSYRGFKEIFSAELWYAVFHSNISHFIGSILTVAIFVLPLTYLFHQIFDRKTNRGKCTVIVTNAIALTLLIQHIGSRIGCLFYGCCYGKPYEGILSVNGCYPTQLAEIIMTSLLLIYCIIRLARKKECFPQTILGFGIIFFISEFFIEPEEAVTYGPFSVIHFFALLLIVIGLLYLIRRKHIFK